MDHGSCISLHQFTSHRSPDRQGIYSIAHPSTSIYTIHDQFDAGHSRFLYISPHACTASTSDQAPLYTYSVVLLVHPNTLESQCEVTKDHSRRELFILPTVPHRTAMVR